MHFLYPTFLYALFLTIIPIVIHLLRLRQYKILPFSNVRFLKTWQTEHRRHSNLRNLLVLCTRVLAIACLVFAFAHPYLPSTEKNKKTQAQGALVSIYLDNSYSMLAQLEGINILEKAKQNAKDVVASYPQNTRFQLLSNRLDGDQQRYYTSEEVLNEIEKVEYSSYPRSWGEIEKKVEEFKESMFIKNVEFYFISDFQKSTLQLPYSAVTDSNIRYILLPTQGDTEENAGIDSLRLDRPVLRPGQESVLSVYVKNYSKKEIEKTPLRIYIGNKLAGLSYVDLKAGEKKEHKIPFVVPENKKFISAKVELSDDPISFDNTRYFSLPVKKYYSIVHVFSEIPAQAIRKIYSNDSSFKYKPFSLTNIDYSLLQSADLLILEGLTEFPSALESELYQRFENGKDVVLIPSSDMMENKELKKTFEKISRVSIQAYDTIEIKADKIDLSSPLFAWALEEESQTAVPISIFCHYVLKMPQAIVYQSIIKAKNEDVLLAQISREKSKLYVLAMPLDEVFSGFAKHFSFVVSFLNMVLLSDGEPILEYTIGADRPIIHFMEKGPVSGIKLKHTESDFFTMPAFRTLGTEYRMETQSMELFSGNYLLLTQKDTLAALSFNESGKESEEELYTFSELKTWIKARPGFDAKMFDLEKSSLKKELEASQSSAEMWKIFLIFALVFLATEMLLLRYWK